MTMPGTEMEANKFVPSHVAGSQFTNMCFSHDSRYLFCCCGSVLRVFNTSNGECLHDLIGHPGIVTGVSVNPRNVLQIFSCCDSGLLISWDYLDGAKLKEHNLHMPLYGIISIDGISDSIIMIAKTTQHETDQYCLLQWSRDRDNSSEFSKPTILIPDCNKDQGLVSFGCNGNFVASAKKRELSVCCMKKKSLRILRDKDKYNKDKAITAVACHPTELCIAAGIESGRIIFWYNFNSGNKAQTSMVHWHSLAVLSLDFSLDGSILLSGGHECVFVRWQMNNQHHKDFKPRMGAPLTAVLNSPDGNYFATLHADNVIQVMDVNLSILHAHRGMSRADWNKDSTQISNPVGLVYDPRSRAIITNGLPGHLQFYSLALQKQLYNLDIVGQNYISPENPERPQVVTEVKQAATSECGQWLATFEIWDDSFFTPELRLKFWEYSSTKQTYVLNTVVETPHEASINSVCFRSSAPHSLDMKWSPMLATTGEDRCFKLWVLVDDTDIYRENTRWDCDSVGFYKDMETTSADFSCDGSSLAVAFDHLLTIWDPDRNIVKTTLSTRVIEKEKIRNAKFGSGDSRYFLVSLTDNHLVSWNLLSLTVEWSINLQFVHLVKDPVSDLMATFEQNSLRIFQPKSHDTVFMQDNICNSSVIAAAFVPDNRPADLVDIGWPGRSQLYIYTANHTLMTLDHQSRLKQTEKVKLHQHLPKTGLSVIMAEKVVKEKQDEDMKEIQGEVHVIEDTFVSSMLYSNEPVSAFCEQFLNKLLIKKKSISTQKGIPADSEEEDIEVDEAADIDKDSDKANFPMVDVVPEPDLVDFMKEESSISKKNGAEFDKLLSKSSAWLNWCQSLEIK